MRIKVYELEPQGGKFVLDKDRLLCIITVKGGKGTFQFRDQSRKKLIESLFNEPSTTFVAGAMTPDGTHADAVQTHPAWSVEAIDAIVKDHLYGHSLGAEIEYDK